MTSYYTAWYVVRIFGHTWTATRICRGTEKFHHHHRITRNTSTAGHRFAKRIDPRPSRSRDLPCRSSIL